MQKKFNVNRIKILQDQKIPEGTRIRLEKPVIWKKSNSDEKPGRRPIEFGNHFFLDCKQNTFAPRKTCQKIKIEETFSEILRNFSDKCFC